MAAVEEGKKIVVCDFRILHHGIICNFIVVWSAQSVLFTVQQSQPVSVKTFIVTWFLCRNLVTRRALWRHSPAAHQSPVSWALVTPACHQLPWLLWHLLHQHYQQHLFHPHQCLWLARVYLVLDQSQQNPAKGMLPFYLIRHLWIVLVLSQSSTPLLTYWLYLFCSVLLVSSPTMPQLGTLLSTAQSSQTQPGPQPPPTRVVSHTASSVLPQVRVVSAQSSLPAVSQQAPVVTQQQQQPTSVPQIRVPATATQTKVLPQVRLAAWKWWSSSDVRLWVSLIWCNCRNRALLTVVHKYCSVPPFLFPLQVYVAVSVCMLH